eukprot:c10134_g4_i2.p1 GENE.c10134_g4_i2~~c10134_g4_i2.p1  ORF type:complete len:122 (+),score=27.80 c10134_g4_i2:30-368(+)
MNNKQSECVILVTFGGDCSIRDDIDETPLYYAIQEKSDSRLISFLKFPFTDAFRKEMRDKNIYTIEKWETFQKEKWIIFCLGKGSRSGTASPIKYLVDDVMQVIAVKYMRSI